MIDSQTLNNHSARPHSQYMYDYNCTYSLYHRERILETSTLSCNEEEEEITKPPKR